LLSSSLVELFQQSSHVGNRGDSPLGLEATDSFLHSRACFVERPMAASTSPRVTRVVSLVEEGVRCLHELDHLRAQAIGVGELSSVRAHEGADVPPADLGDDVLGCGSGFADPGELLSLLEPLLAAERLCELGRDR
jgi:hypothetical protein